MKFKEIFEKYKSGQASSEEIEFINEEIEKNEIINDYLAEMIPDEFTESFKIDNDFKYENKTENIKDIEEETSSIKKKVNRKMKILIYKGIISGFALLFLIRILVAPIVSVFFYNPTNSVNGIGGENELYIDTSIFTELHFPGYYIDNTTSSKSLGFGIHNIKIVQNDIFNNDNIIVEGKSRFGNVDIDREELILLPNNIFYKEANPEYNKIKDEFNDNLKLIAELPKSSMIESSITFKDDISIDKLLELDKKYGLNIVWVGVRNEKQSDNRLIGFNPSGRGDYLFKDSYYFNLPYLKLENKEEFTADILETHFKSMLEYMGGKTHKVPIGDVIPGENLVPKGNLVVKGREDFIKRVYNINNLNDEYYKETLEYVNKNGINTYGIKIISNRDLLLKFLEDDIIENIYIEDVKLSVFEK